MRVSVVPAGELSAAQLAVLQARLQAPEHAHDRGACMFWDRPAALPKIFAGVLTASGTPVGIVHVAGPLAHVHPAWWIDSRCRGQGLGGEMVDVLAALLKADGCTGAARIQIDTFGGQYDLASAALARRFAAHFVRSS